MGSTGADRCDSDRADVVSLVGSPAGYADVRTRTHKHGYLDGAAEHHYGGRVSPLSVSG